MGGYWSGRYMRLAVKNSRRVNQFSAVDIRQYRKRLQSGEPARAEFRYQIKGDPEVIDVSALVVWIPYRFGLRPFFECPVCGQRCCLLYLAEKCACRQCLRLAYPVQFETELDQGFRRAWKDRHRAKAAHRGDSLGSEIPDCHKPKGMHWQTFNRLREQAAVSAAAAFGVLLPIQQKMHRQLDRIQQRRN